MNDSALYFIRRVFIGLILLSIAPLVIAETPEQAFIYISPVPSSEYILKETTILLRTGQPFSPADSAELAGVTITGVQSGEHAFSVILSDDINTAILRPEIYFTPDESVTVEFDSLSINSRVVDGSFAFMTAEPAARLSLNDLEKLPGNELPPIPGSGSIKKNDDDQLLDVDPSLPYDFPPRVLLTNDNPDSGYVFISNMGVDAGTTYLMILGDNAYPVYYRKMPYWSWDFKKQPNGYLSYIVEDTPFFMVMDSTYAVVDSFRAQNGYFTDEHDLQLLDNGHALIAAYDYQTVDMSQIIHGGNEDARVIGYVIQELDSNKNVVFQWRSWDHLEITEATEMGFTGSVIDYVHGNTLELDSDGNILTSFRNMESLTKINRQTGETIWRLGGVRNQFNIVSDSIGWSRQHDLRRLANGNITIYNNGRLFPYPYNYSSANEYRLDEDNMTCTLVRKFSNDPEVFGPFMGNNQRLPNGNALIGWGGQASISVTEVRPDSTKAWEMTFVTYEGQRNFSYRAFRFPWHGVASKPYLIVEPTDSLVHLVFNKFGDSSVAQYYIYVGPSPEPATIIDSASENYYNLDFGHISNGYNYFRVTAVDGFGAESPFSNEEALYLHVFNQYLPGDANMANGAWPPAVIGSDVTYLVNYFRDTPVNPACLINGNYMAADMNGSCSVIGSDVTRLVSYFRGQATIQYCPDWDPAWITPADCPEMPPAGWPNCQEPIINRRFSPANPLGK